MDTTWARLPATVQEYEPALLPLNPQEGTDTIHKRAMEIKPRCNSILTRNTEYTMEHAAYQNPFDPFNSLIQKGSHSSLSWQHSF